MTRLRWGCTLPLSESPVMRPGGARDCTLPLSESLVMRPGGARDCTLPLFESLVTCGQAVQGIVPFHFQMGEPSCSSGRLHWHALLVSGW